MIDELSILDMELTIESSEEFDILCRELTSTDVDQALYTLKVNQKPSRKSTISSDNESLTVLHKEGKSLEGFFCSHISVIIIAFFNNER